MLKPFIKRALARENLSTEEVVQAFGHIMDGEASPAQIAALLIAQRCKGESLEAIASAESQRLA